MGRSRSESRTSSTQTSDVQNLNLQDIDGIALAGVDGSVAITSTVSDQGAIDAGRDIAIASIDAGSAGFNETVDLVGDVIDAARSQSETLVLGTLDFAADAQRDAFDVVGDFGRDALGFGRDSLDFAADSQRDAFDVVGGFGRDSLDFAQNTQTGVFELIEDFGAFGSDLITQQQEFVADAGNRVISSISAIQARESGNTDARLEEVTRFALIGAAVIALAAIATQFRK